MLRFNVENVLLSAFVFETWKKTVKFYVVGLCGLAGGTAKISADVMYGRLVCSLRLGFHCYHKFHSFVC